MIVTTGNEIAGQPIASYLGVVVRSPSLGQSFLGSFQSLGGGNIETFTHVCEQAREEAYNRMTQHALQLGADAIIAMRYDATEFGGTMTEVLAYGTAVKLAR